MSSINSLTGACTNDFASISLSNAATPTFYLSTIVPAGKTALDVTIYYYQVDGGSGTVGWSVKAQCLAAGGARDSTFPNAAATTSGSAPATNIWAMATIPRVPLGTCAAGSLAKISVSRDNSVGSNYASPAKVAEGNLIWR